MGRQINTGGPQGPGKPDTAVALARSIDHLPTKQLSDTPVLIAQERELLVRCEAALENLRVAYWAAGKALQVIRDGKLYRATRKTFEDYCNELWDITPQYANQLIKTWKITEKLFELVHGKPNDLETAVSKKLGIAQARELGLARRRARRRCCRTALPRRECSMIGSGCACRVGAASFSPASPM